MRTAMSSLQVSSFCSGVASLRNVFTFICSRMMAYSKSAPNTKKMQQITHDCMAFRPSAFGELLVVVLKMFTCVERVLGGTSSLRLVIELRCRPPPLPPRALGRVKNVPLSLSLSLKKAVSMFPKRDFAWICGEGEVGGESPIAQEMKGNSGSQKQQDPILRNSLLVYKWDRRKRKSNGGEKGKKSICDLTLMLHQIDSFRGIFHSATTLPKSPLAFVGILYGERNSKCIIRSRLRYIYGWAAQRRIQRPSYVSALSKI